MNIVSIDRTGPVAVVHVKDLYQAGHFTDYLTIVEGEDGWRIVNKAFFSADQVAGSHLKPLASAATGRG